MHKLKLKLQNILVSIVHESTIAGTILGIAVEQLLFGELLQVASFDGIRALNVAGHTECPTGAALSLVLDMRHCILLPPVKFLGQLTRMGGHHSSCAARRLVLAALPETGALCVLRAGHVRKLGNAILGAALLIGIQLLDSLQALAENAQPHLMLSAVGIATLVLDLELVEQMVHLVERVMIVLLVCLLLGPLHGAAVASMHGWLIVALERHFVSLFQPRLRPDLHNAAPLCVIAVNQVRIDARQSARDNLTRGRIDLDNSVRQKPVFKM